MTAPLPTTDMALRATGLLREFCEHGVLDWADFHPALHLGFLFGEPDERVRLALALTVRALRAGSLCIDLTTVASDPALQPEDPQASAPPWPELAPWLDAVRVSPCVTEGADPQPGSRPLRLVGTSLYLERYWRDEEAVRQGLLRLHAQAPSAAGDYRASQKLDPTQQCAVEVALGRGFSVIAGGPGTGKTTIIAEILAGARAHQPDILIGLAAPTGKAAARMTESLRESGAIPAAGGAASHFAASTIHRLLGWRPESRLRFRHDSTNPLPHDLVIIDETSMVPMTLMARLLEALKPSARLVLVGDPDQLESVEAGAVLADVTAASTLRDAVTHLRHNYRFAGAIASLADAIRDGRVEEALEILGGSAPEVVLLDDAAGVPVVRERAVAAGANVFAAAQAGDAAAALVALDSHRVLCAHRTGPFGVSRWSQLVRAWLGAGVPGYSSDAEFYVGRPLMMTRNAPDLDLYNGDTGVVLAPDNGATLAAFGTGHGPSLFSPWVIDGLESVDAMTIHKAQGSQFDAVSVVLPPLGSPLLTRELLYTAVSRARNSVVLVGTPEAVREAIARPARRTSGLAPRL